MKTFSILNSVKSGYFMLVTCATLLFGASACSHEEFGVEVPEVKKEWTKQELIEQALSRMPQTRNGNENEGTSVQMITINKTVAIKCRASKSMTIHWGDNNGSTHFISSYSDSVYTFTYSDTYQSHAISIEGSLEAIQTLNLDSNRLIYLEINAPKLNSLYCTDNLIDALDLKKCPNLTKVDVANNELTSINVDSLSRLQVLRLPYNYLKEINVSKNNLLVGLLVNDNQIKEIDLTNNPNMTAIEIGNNPIKNLDIRSNLKLQYISIENLPLETLNGIPIETENFDEFNKYEKLANLFIAYTPFTSLDVSQIPLRNLYISGTAITRLDISNSKIERLYATRSKLTELTYSNTTFDKAYDIRIERTPFEDEWDCIRLLVSALPNRSKEIKSGILYTYTQYIIYPYIANKNWIINP